jgi:hypothetical protein
LCYTKSHSIQGRQDPEQVRLSRSLTGVMSGHDLCGTSTTTTFHRESGMVHSLMLALFAPFSKSESGHLEHCLLLQYQSELFGYQLNICLMPHSKVRTDSLHNASKRATAMPHLSCGHSLCANPHRVKDWCMAPLPPQINVLTALRGAERPSMLERQIMIAFA